MIQLENTLQNVGKHNGVIIILTGKDVVAWRFWIAMNSTGSWLFISGDARS
jgi:hypothetical protein